MDEAAGVNDFGPLRVRSIVRRLQQLLIEGERLRGFFGSFGGTAGVVECVEPIGTQFKRGAVLHESFGMAIVCKEHLGSSSRSLRGTVQMSLDRCTADVVSPLRTLHGD
jgi:hypothetical protein